MIQVADAFTVAAPKALQGFTVLGYLVRCYAFKAFFRLDDVDSANIHGFFSEQVVDVPLGDMVFSPAGLQVAL